MQFWSRQHSFIGADIFPRINKSCLFYFSVSVGINALIRIKILVDLLTFTGTTGPNLVEFVQGVQLVPVDLERN